MSKSFFDEHFIVIPIGFDRKCRECDRTFDLTDADDAAEWAYGHDCEA